MNASSDEHIVQKTQNGDAESFGILVERYEAKLLRYGRKFLTNNDDIIDLVQEVFLRAYTNIQDFDTTRRFSPWLYRIAHNAFINALKKTKSEPLHFFDPDTILPHLVADQNTENVASERELKERMNSSIDNLGAKYREPLILRFFENLSYDEIADILRIPVSTVGVRISRAKAALKIIYENGRG